MLAALVLSGAVSYGAYILGEKAVSKMVVTEEKTDNRRVELLNSFSDFVRENDIASDDTKSFGEWSAKNQNVALTVFSGKNITKSSDGSGNGTVKLKGFSARSLTDYPLEESDIIDAVYSNYDFIMYPVVFSDCVGVVAIFDSRADDYNDIVVLFTVLIFFGLFVLIMLGFNKLTINRIKSFSNQVNLVGQGAKQTPITLSGDDELTELASDVEDMRETLVEKGESEKNAWEANRELITSISHDLRTPLTALLGYSDILVNGQYGNAEQLDKYIKSINDKAYRLKDLTDELFGYFVVFGKPEIAIESTNENAQILIQQLAGEKIAELRTAGYTVEETWFEENVWISVDVMHFKRVFDNLYSNLFKYADKNKPVVFNSQLCESELVLTLSNSIRHDSTRFESTKIGTKICAKLCEAMQIDFKYGVEGEVFTTELRIPVCENTEN